MGCLGSKKQLLGCFSAIFKTTCAAPPPHTHARNRSPQFVKKQFVDDPAPAACPDLCLPVRGCAVCGRWVRYTYLAAAAGKGARTELLFTYGCANPPARAAPPLPAPGALLFHAHTNLPAQYSCFCLPQDTNTPPAARIRRALRARLALPRAAARHGGAA